MPDLVRKWKEQNPFFAALDEEAEKERKRRQEEQQRQEARRRYQEDQQRRESQFQAERNREIADMIRESSPLAQEKEAQRQRVDAARGAYRSTIGEEKTGRGRRFQTMLDIPTPTGGETKGDKKSAVDLLAARREPSPGSAHHSLDTTERTAAKEAGRARADTFGSKLALGYALMAKGQNPFGDQIPELQENIDSAWKDVKRAEKRQTAAETQHRDIVSRYQRQLEQQQYGSLRFNTDFRELSQPDEKTAERGANSPTKNLGEYYQIYHRKDVYDPDKPANEQALYQDTELRYLTDNEADTYFYLWNKEGQGPRAAHAYLETIRYKLNERRQKVRQEYLSAYARENPGAASVASVAMNAGSIIGVLDLTMQNIRRALGDRRPVDYNSSWQDLGRDAAKIRESVAGKIAEENPGAADLATFLYMTGMSIADSVPQTLAAMLGAPPALTTAMLGMQSGSAALQAVYDAKDRGASDGQALIYGYAAGIAEYAFEKISLDTFVDSFVSKNGMSFGEKLFNKTFDDKFRNFVMKLGKNITDIGVQGGVEASEEAFTTLANTITDLMINRDKSELLQSIQTKIRDARAMNPKADPTEIEKQAITLALKEWVTSLGADALGGLVSGGFYGVAGAGFRGAMNKIGSAVGNVVADAQTAREQNPLQYALDKAANGETLTKNDARAILEDEQAMQTLRDAGVLTEDVRNDSEGRTQILQAVEALAEQNRAETVQATEELSQAPAQNSQLPVQNQQETAQERPAPPVPSGMQQTTETGTAAAPVQAGPPLPSRVTQEQESRAETPAAQETAQGASEGLRLPSRAEAVESKPTTRANLTIGAAQERSGNLWTAQRTRENAPMLEAIRTANEDLLSSYMTAEIQGDSDTAVIDAVNAVWQNVKQGDISPMAGAELLNKMWAAGKDDAARNMYLKSIIDNDGNLRAAALNAARSIDAEHRNGGLRIGQQTDIAAEAAAAAAENTAAEEAGNDLDYGGRGRVSGQRAGEQAGRVAGRKQALTQPGKAIGRRADAKNLRVEEVNARERIPAAAEGSTLKIVPEQMVRNDKELRAVAKRLEAITGKKVYYTIDNIRYRGADGKISNARGAITEDGIYLRCDHNDLTVTQIGAHELYHYYEQQFPGLSARMKEKIIERYSAEEFKKVAQVYIEKLGGICGLTENMDAQAREEALARVEAEIFADAFGNINYFGSGVTKFTDLVRGEVNATAGTENAAATQRKTGPPTQFSDDETNETRFSTDEDTDTDYLAAVNSGDLETAQRMVDEAAKKAGYTTKLYHGTSTFGFTQPRGMLFATDSMKTAGTYSGTKDARNISNTIGSSNGMYQLYANTDGMLEVDADGAETNHIALGDIEYEFNNNQGYKSWRTFATISQIIKYAKESGHTGVVVRNVIDSATPQSRKTVPPATDYVFFNPRAQVKSADPVTYDNDGNIIPLSERFNPKKQDIRWSTDEEEYVPDNAAEYSRERYLEENRVPESAAEYARIKERARAREAELRRLEKKGKATAEERREAAELRKKLQPPKAKVQKQQATIAKKDLRNTLISQFSVPDGRKAEIGKMIDAYADRLIRDKRLTEADRRELFDKLYSEGVMTVPADDMYQAARELVRGGKIYVPESVKHEFGDDWNSFRTDAFREGIFLTNNPEDKGADSWNVELASEFPGLFPEDNYDQRDILERIVSAAQAGRDEKMSLAEYAANVVGQEYVSEDDLLDNMERQLDWALRTFADKAGLETWLRDKSEEKLAKQREKFGERLDAVKAQEIARRAKEREKRKEAARKQTEQKQLREMQQRTLKQLQWLSRNRQKFSGNMQDRLNEILSDIDVYAISAADEAHLDKASNKTWRELADIYKDARENDPNFLPSKDLERIVERLDNRKIGDMDIDAVTDLYKAAVGLRTELYNRNNVIGSELHETFQEVYDQVKDEMQKAKGGYQTGAKGMAQKFFSDLQLTPMNLLERMAGWNKDSAWYKMAKQLEQGERAQRKFKTDSARMLAPFLEEHKDWVKKADGQGKDAIWYEIEVPELLELGMGDKPIFGNTVKVWMTPAQKVHMYLESQNYDNLRHMTGGRTFADKELYSKGKRAEAFAQGKTIRLAPETVKNLVKDLTPEEKALADALRPFYNEFSKKEINRVSNLLLGYNKAMEGDYAPIYTNQNYTKSEPGIFDTTAEGVGNLKSRVVSANPSLNISALDAFEKSVDRTSRYVGLAVPVRNMNTLMNWREKGNSMADVLTHKWGEDGKRFVNDLLTELQSGRETEQSSIEKLTNAALSRYISAVFGANPSIVTKQFASYPLAATYLNWKNMPVNVIKAAQVDTDLMAKYTGELDYRLLGYAMPETATLKDNPGKLQERGPLNFIFGGGAITWMDGFTVRTLWTAAENKVKREQPGLEKGSREDIDAGKSEYYKAVAAEFEEALSRSQPMYDVMHRSNIMRESNPITRAFTLFKTVPQQEYNMLRQAIGEAQYAKESGASKEEQAEARQKAGRAFTGILAGNLMIGAITMLNALWKNRGKKYRDEDGELNAEKLIAEAGKQYFKDAAGLMIGGDIVADVLSAILFGDKWYGLETPGIEQIGSILEQTVKAGSTVRDLVRDSIEVLANGGDWVRYMADHSEKYLNAVDGVMRTLGTYATGLPIDNVKAYLLGAVQWLSPEIKTAYEDAMSKADRSGLKGLKGASLEIRTANILKDRMGGADEETVEALAGLYEAGYRDAIPAAQVTSITVNGEDRTLNLAQQQTYADTWRDVVEGSLDDLVSSQTFRDADEKTQEKMLSKLYDLAKSKAAGAVFDDYKESSGLDKAEAAEDAGIDLADYVAIYAKYNEIANDDSLSSYEKGKQQRDLVESMSASDDAKMALYSVLNSTATSRIAKFETLMDADLSFADVMKIYDKYASLDSRDDMKAGDKAKDFILWVDTQKYTGKQKELIKDTLKYFSQIPAEAERYEKLTDAGLDANTAYNVDKAISALKPEEGKNDVSALQKWQAAIKTVNGEANQRKALQALMTDEQYEKFKTASDAGISPSIYVQYKAGTKDITGDKDKNGETISGSLKKNVIEYIDTLPLTSEQKTTLLLDYNKTYSTKGVTWHSSGGGKTGGDKARIQLPTQRQPWEMPTRSKLTLPGRSTVRTQRPASRLTLPSRYSK